MITKILQRAVQYSTLFNNQNKTINPKSLKQYSKKSSNKTPEVHLKLYSSKESSFMDPTTSMIDNDFEIRSRAHRICSDHLGGAWAKISQADISLIPIR